MIKLETFVKLSIGLGLLAFTAYNCYNSLKRFSDHNVAVSVKRTKTPSLNYPAVTVCSWVSRSGDSVTGEVTNRGARMEDVINRFPTREEVVEIANYNVTWETHLDRIGGRCYTADTDTITTPGGQNEQIKLVVTIPSNHTCLTRSFSVLDCGLSFPVFLHERGDFLYNIGHENMGSNFELGARERNTYLVLTRQNRTVLSSESNPCSEDATFARWRECLLRFAVRDRGCVLPWQKGIVTGISNLPVCNSSTITSSHQYFDYNMSYGSEHLLALQSGCVRPCSNVEFKMTRVKYSSPIDTTMKMNLYLYYPGSFVEEYTEYEAFDIFSLVSELGGLLGLFLGWSFYQMVALVTDWLGLFVRTRVK